MKTLVSFSSGKDSAWMIHVLRQTPGVELAGLLTTVNAAAGRVAMHAVRESLLQMQADALGLPLQIIHIPSPCPNEVYEQLMRDAVRRAVAANFTHIAFGDLFLEDIRAYRERIEKLREVLEDAEERGDAGRAERARSEMEAIAGEISKATTKGGRARRGESAVDRARSAVQRRIKDALDRIAEQDEVLGEKIRRAVTTGNHCSYRPRA